MTGWGDRWAKVTDGVRDAVAEASKPDPGLSRPADGGEHGRLVKRGTFGVKTVEVYDGGFVRVGVMLTARSPYERLRSIGFTTQVQDRSGLGHLWTSGGLGSREKRVLLLTIATDEQVHTLSTEGQAGRAEDKLGLALEAAGTAVVRRDTAPPAAPAAPAATTPDKLRELAALHRDGVVSDEEFAAAKARLLGQL